MASSYCALFNGRLCDVPLEFNEIFERVIRRI